MGKSITIRDIAKEAGVSISTVSRVLNGSANVKEDKRQDIQRLIDEHDFHPNMLARSLIQTQTMQIGFIIADICNPYYSAVFASCEKAANNYGYTLLLMDSFSEQHKEIELLEKMVSQQVDAIIMLGGSVDSVRTYPAFREKIRSVNSQIPVVVTGHVEDSSCPCINIDAKLAMEKLMEYLNSCGYSKIAFAGGTNGVYFASGLRENFRKLLVRYNLPYYSEFDVQSPKYDEVGGYSVANAILSGKELPDVIICVNDFTAVGVMNALNEKGLRVPEDVGVVSFDDTFISTLVTPKLTSIGYNYPRFGEQIIKLAVDLIEGMDVPSVSLTEPELIIRDSCRKK